MTKNRIISSIHAILLEKGLTASTAESFTSGRIATCLTTLSGSSKYFQGGLIAYQDEVKIKELGVDADLIKTHGVVSREVAEAMVQGALERFGTDFALASTGYADYAPSQNGPVEKEGFVWLAWGSKNDVRSVSLRLSEGRLRNSEKAVVRILEEFFQYLKNRETNLK